MMKAVILCAFGQDMGCMQCSSLKRAAHEMAILLWAQGGTASVTLVRFPNHPQGRGEWSPSQVPPDTHRAGSLSSVTHT